MATPEVAGEGETTWVPVYVERAICDLIPDMGYAREIARKAWAWDDEHPDHKNDLYRWQNEAILQRRDLIALQEFIQHEQNPYPVTKEEQADDVCQSCFSTMTIREGCDPTKYCDTCAQDLLKDIEAVFESIRPAQR